jgi:hypothetical protein
VQVTLVAVIGFLTIAAGVAGLWRRTTRLTTTPTPEQRARAAGHPSAPRVLSIGERRLIAGELASTLTQAGLRLARMPLDGDVQVQVMGEDGPYTLHVGRDYVTVDYLTNGGHQHLGRFLSTSRAAEAVTTHAGLSPQH